MYPFITLLVNYTFIPINRQDLPVNISTALHVHRCTCSSLYLFSLFVPFRHTIHSYLSTHLLGYCSEPQIYPKIKLPVYLHASLLSNHKDLPVTTTTCVHAHRSTRSLPYLFILIISFQANHLYLAVLSPVVLNIRRFTFSSINCSICVCFSSGFTCTLICQLICWSAY